MNKAEYLHDYYLANKERLLAYRQAWYQANKKHVIAQAREYQEAHKDQVKKWARDGRKRRKDWLKRTPEQRQAEHLRYQEKNIKRSREWRAAHPGATWEQVKAWKAKNPEKYKVYKLADTAKRRGALRRTVTVEQFKALIDQQNGRCAYCHLPLQDFHVDHRTPLSKGGQHELKNLALACSQCNLRKHTKTADEFVKEFQRVPTQVRVIS